MKRSFYEMFGLQHDARQEQIDAAYTRQTARLNAVNLRGAAETVIEARLIQEGYQILSDPEKRSKYDAKLTAAESGVQLIFFPAGQQARHKLGVETLIFAMLASVLAAIVYHQFTSKMQEVRVEHVQAVSRYKEDQAKAILIDASKLDSAVAISTARSK